VPTQERRQPRSPPEVISREASSVPSAPFRQRSHNGIAVVFRLGVLVGHEVAPLSTEIRLETVGQHDETTGIEASPCPIAELAITVAAPLNHHER